MVATLAIGLLLCEAWRLAIADRLSASTANSANPANQAAKHIRIAFIHRDDMPFTPMRHLIKRLGPAGNRTLLPDYDITIDSFPIKSGSPEGDLTPVMVVNIIDDKTAKYSAIAGPTSRVDTLAMVNVVGAAQMLHVHKGSSPIFSNRTLYPYTFRAVRPLQGVLSIWLHMAHYNGWPMVISLWMDAENLEYSAGLASSLNIRMFNGVTGRDQSAFAVEAMTQVAIDLTRTTRSRVVMLYVQAWLGWQLICELYRAQLSGIQFFVPPEAGWENGWFLREDLGPSIGSCTPDEVYKTVAGHLLVNHVQNSPGLNFLGGVSLPPIGGDFSHVPLTCTPDITAHEWYNNPEHLSMAAEDGFVSDLPSAQAYFAEAGSEQDQVCQILLAIHDAIYRKGIPLENIEARESTAFEALVSSMQEVEFVGPTGPFRFTNGTPDPEYVYHTISQLALPWVDNVSQPIQAVATWPDGPSGQPRILELHELYPSVARLHWADGSLGVGPNQAGLYPDCTLVNGELKWDSCEPCPPGTAYDRALMRCRTCPAGQYQDEIGAESCIATPPGSFSVDPGAVRPSPCPVGYECPQAGMTQPQPCAKGRFAANAGQASCDLCPVGTYREEEGGLDCSSCALILAGSITANLASKAPEACICPEGTYRDSGEEPDDACLVCLEGMICPEGSELRNLMRYLSVSQDLAGNSSEAPFLLSAYPFPQVQRGYMTRLSNPMQVYLCVEEEHCPGGPPGSCDRYRDSLTRACGDCENDAYETGDHCKPCGAASSVPFIVVGVIAVAAVVACALLVNRDVHKVPSASLMIVASAGLMFTAVQSMGVFSQMAVVWMEPVKSVLALTKLLSFDLKVLQTACIMGVNPVRKFALRQTPAVVAIPFIALTLLTKRYAIARRGAKEQTRVFTELVNAVGSLYSVFFISIVISAMDPFICYEHPGDSGESVRSAPSLLCFQGGEHTNMMIIGIVVVCVVPLPFVAVCGYAILVYASSMRTNNGRAFLHTFRFLFFRYVPQYYYFQIIVFLRSLGLCLAPVIFRGQASTQVLFMCAVLAWYVLLVQFLNPWRCRPCTPVDAVMTMLLLIMLICGALFIEDTPQSNAVTALAMCVAVGVFGSGAGAILYAVRQRLTPAPYYHYFICHHKAHAAAQARYLKILLQKKRRAAQVFIDSDNLQELDTLFDIVKSRVGHLLVYLTSDTLKRPWCAGEVVTALRARIHVTRLQTPSFVHPSEEQMQHPNQYLDVIGCNLGEYGIEWDDVTDAFKQFFESGVPQLDLSLRFLGTRRFDQLAAAVLKQNGVEARVQAMVEIPVGCVFISTFAESDEANASSGILAAHISEDVFRICEEGLTILSDFKPDPQHLLRVTQTASVGVVILTPGCLRSVDQVMVICELMRFQGSTKGPGVISVNTPGFEFPAPAQIEKLCEDLPDLNAAYDGVAADHMKSFFKHITVLLPTHASQKALDTQADEVCRRIATFMKAKKKQLPSDESSGRTLRIASPTSSYSGGNILPVKSKDQADPDMVTIVTENETCIALDSSKIMPSSSIASSGLASSGFTWTMDLTYTRPTQ